MSDHSIEACKAGYHLLRNIYIAEYSFGEEHIVQWCEYCGSFMVSRGTDGRVMGTGSIVKMRTPAIAYQMAREKGG